MPFELLGGDDDETRLLVERSSGFSIPLVGRPAFTPVQPTPGGPTYDAVVALRDVQAEHGFRLDTLPAHDDPRALSKSLVEAYAEQRAEKPPTPTPIGASERAAGTVFGGRAIYPLRDAPALMEQVEIVLRPTPNNGLWAMVQTTRFAREALDVIHWGHLRSAVFEHGHWDPAAPRTDVPRVWPESELALPSAALELTEAGWAEARAKARDLGVMSGRVIEQIADLMCGIARESFPPGMPVIEMLTMRCRGQITMAAPADSAGALLRNLDACKTAFDLRAWAKQCVWALENRATKDALRNARTALEGEETSIAYDQLDVPTLVALAAVQQNKPGIAVHAFRELSRRGAASHCVCEMILRQPWDNALAAHALATLSRIDSDGAVFLARLWRPQDASLNELVPMLKDAAIAYDALVEHAHGWFAGVPANRRDMPLRADILRVPR